MYYFKYNGISAKYFLISIIVLYCFSQLAQSAASMASKAKRLPENPFYYQFHPIDDNKLLIIEYSGNVKLYDVQKNKNFKLLLTLEANANRAVFSPNGELIATSNKNGKIQLWDINGNSKININSQHAGAILGLTFSPDGKILASAGKDSTIRLWNLDGTVKSEPFVGGKGLVKNLAFSPNGQLLASVGQDAKVYLWDLDGNLQAKPFTAHKDLIRSVVFSPDGQYLASGDKIGIVHLWDLSGRQLAGPLKINKDIRGSVNSLIFSPKGNLLLASGRDNVNGVIRYWDLKEVLKHNSSITKQSEIPTLSFVPGIYTSVRAIAFDAGGQILKSMSRHRNKGSRKYSSKLFLWNFLGWPENESVSAYKTPSYSEVKKYLPLWRDQFNFDLTKLLLASRNNTLPLGNKLNDMFRASVLPGSNITNIISKFVENDKLKKANKKNKPKTYSNINTLAIAGFVKPVSLGGVDNSNAGLIVYVKLNSMFMQAYEGKKPPPLGKPAKGYPFMVFKKSGERLLLVSVSKEIKKLLQVLQ